MLGDRPVLAAPAGAGSAPFAKPRPTGAWTDPATVLPGCGPRIAELLAARGVHRVGDLLGLLPRRYEDRRAVRAIAELAPVSDGERVVVRAQVVRARAVPRRFVELLVEEVGGGPRLTARWFHVHGGFAQRFRPGERLLLAGPLRRYKGQPQMAHPDVLPDGATGIRPVYPDIEGIPPRALEKLARAAVERYADAAPEPLPEALRTRLDLPALAPALRELHAPRADLPRETVAALDGARTPAHRRLAFGEFFLLQLGLGRRRGAARREPGLPCHADAPSALARLRAVLPFVPTRAQERAIAALARALAGPAPIAGHLQGDVGSGKTLVAFAAAHLALSSGFQAAVMAPTEILAEQHLRTMEAWARALGWRVALLTASTPRGVRESLLALIQAGQIHLLIGTHALLAERVDFAHLGLAVVDEQHRFGVEQRARLREKGASGAAAPHLLVMTATPIPRTLALTAYGDLDLTVIDELPPGRRPPRTRVYVGPRARSRAYAQVGRALAAGRQAFVVCPLVEDSDKVDFAAAVSTADELARLLPAARVGLIHGRLGAAEKDDVMARFRARQVDLLVATTVIEVGVDVPDASVMVVEHAERFGLAQLHQLRGRVGRSPEADALCML